MNKRLDLIEEHKKENPDMNTVLLRMNESYPLQRNLINQNKPICEIKLQWPFLFSQNTLINRFALLTGKLESIQLEDVQQKQWNVYW